MPDALVNLLNNKGYQPVLLPQTDLLPPDLYNVADGMLMRRGQLSFYLPPVSGLSVGEAKLPDLEEKFTTRKSLAAAVSFLQDALECLGISSIPKLDLSFAAKTGLRFAFTDVTSRSVPVAGLDQIIQGVNLGAIPARYVEEGNLHIAHKYIYARKLLMMRQDQRRFDLGASGDISEFIKLGEKAKVEVESEIKISFSKPGRERIAFAYKSVRLVQNGPRWELLFGRVRLGEGADGQSFLPQPGKVVRAAFQQ
jgi:hypothetical protein